MSAAELRSAWHAFCEDLKDGAEIALDPDRKIDDVDRVEGIQALLRRLAGDTSRGLEGGDVFHPQLAWCHPFKNGQDNPDGLYQIAEIDLAATYRLSGSIGTVSYLGITAMTTKFATQGVQQFLTLKGDELILDADGRFEVFFGAGPAPDEVSNRNWFPLPPQECSLMIRQFFQDWENEVPADLHLECLNPESVRTRMDAGTLLHHLNQLSTQVVDMTAFWAEFGGAHLERDEINSFSHVQAAQGVNSNLGGSVDQGYGQTWYRIADHEALVLEVEIPDCVYWGIQLGDVWYQSLNWWDRQSSLNGHQAVVSSDGVFRAIIAHHDPGVANWLDTTGSTQGCITYRWNQAVSQPIPTCELVAFDTLSSYLDDRWKLITPGERAVVLRDRRRGALRRFRR
ncbi:MAG: DUF1214 domain-containing protein [Acidimicrobiales bacterium]|nr:DUF1214 domain-containing protein [Acidimicrobiales bacterium]